MGEDQHKRSVYYNILAVWLGKVYVSFNRTMCNSAWLYYMYSISTQSASKDEYGKGASIFSCCLLNPNNVQILVGGRVMEHQLFGS